ncbi:CFI-box-CTERM domain-containing protein [Xanthomonas hortorum]
MLQQKLDSASEKLKSLNPDYIAPTIEKKKADACFVVTATMGDENHPTVSLLREFRATILSGSYAGEAFIRWYYQNGPRLARVVKRSKYRRAISYFFVVLPSALAASLFLRARRK